MYSIDMKLPNSSCKIVFADCFNAQLLEAINEFRDKRLMIVTDSKVNSLYGDEIINNISKISSQVFRFEFKQGERSKRMKSIMELIDSCLAHGWSRDDVFIILGGGIVGDMGAFTASILLRGIKYIQIPTTLLSQVDSSIGGKTGVNHQSGKNLIGSFYQPQQVLISSHFLKTLTLRDVQTGFSEIIKYGMIQNQKLFIKIDNFFKLFL